MTTNTIYICDRCQVETRTDGRIPEGWSQHRLFDSYTEPITRYVALCGLCTDDLHSFLVRAPKRTHLGEGAVS